MYQGFLEQQVGKCFQKLDPEDAAKWVCGALPSARVSALEVILAAWIIIVDASDGQVSRENFEVFFTQLLQRMGMKNRRKQDKIVQQVLKEMDTNQDGLITFDKFSRVIYSGYIMEIVRRTPLKIFQHSNGEDRYVDMKAAKTIIKAILDKKGGFDKLRNVLGCSTSTTFNAFVMGLPPRNMQELLRKVVGETIRLTVVKQPELAIITRDQLRSFLGSHDASELFYTDNPGDDDLDEFLEKVPPEEVAEMLEEVYGDTIIPRRVKGGSDRSVS